MVKDSVMHVISHTHWDREWYLPFQGFRMKLVDMMDNLLNILESDPEYRCFHLDGQTIMLDDYMEIRPENRGRLQKLIAEGRILVGPWYVQPDEFLPSGEAHIRNLLLGRRVSEAWGAEPLPVGYVVDLFGHVSQMPQIFQGFGISHALLFRGLYRDLAPAEFRWASPDGTEVTAFHLHDDYAYSTFWYAMHCGTPDHMGTYFGKHRPPLREKAPFDPEQSATRGKWLLEDLGARSATRHILAMDGIDHIEANPHTPATISAINERIDGAHLVHDSLTDYIAAFSSEVDPEALSRLDGELRWPNKDGALNAVLVGTLSSRIYNKLDNDECQRLLERWVEPFAALTAWTLPEYEYPRAFVDRAWKWLIENHPHDSICGCSIDQVHKDMTFRFDQARLIGQGVLDRTLWALGDNVSRAGVAPQEAQLVLVNARAKAAGGATEIVSFELDTSRLPAAFDLADEAGLDVPYQVLDSRPAIIHDLCGHDVPSFRSGTHYRLALDLSATEGTPGLGYTALAMRPRTGPKRSCGSMVTGERAMENEYLRVEVAPDSCLTLTDKVTGEVWSGLNAFEDRGDFGDGWNWTAPEFDATFGSGGSPFSVSVISDGPLAATLMVRVRMLVPAGAGPDRRHRSDTLVELPITSLVTLRKGARMVDIETTIDNLAKDHRLSVVLPTGVKADTYYTDTQFDVVERPVARPDCSTWREAYPTTAPLQNFVGVSSAVRSLGVVVQGVRECSVYDREDRAIAVTLLRGFSAAVATTGNEGGQCLGARTFRYALVPGAGDWRSLALFDRAEEFLLPLAGLPRDASTHVSDALPRRMSFAQVGDACFSSIKQAENGADLILRVFNPSRDELNCAASVEGAGHLELTSMDERASGQAVGSCGEGQLCVKAGAIATVRIVKAAR